VGYALPNPLTKGIVCPLGDIRSAAIAYRDERRQRLALAQVDIPFHRKPQQLVDLLLGEVLDKY
jgi:hypothetical protein